MSWREALFGLDGELTSSEMPIEMAFDHVSREDRPTPALADLASQSKAVAIRRYVEALANAEPRQEPNEIQGKWLYLALAWVLANKGSFSDPLQMVEKIYADFGYPERVAKFVRYMPSDDPDLGSRELNERRLYAKWIDFLDELAGRYALR